MAEGSRFEPRSLLRWVFLALVVLYAFVDVDAVEDGVDVDVEDPIAHVERGGADIALRDVRPSRVGPGGAVIVTLEEANADLELSAEVDGRPAELLYQQGDQRVFQIPADATLGPAVLQLRAGELLAEPQELEVRTVKRRKVIRSVVGGLALVVFGLQLLSRGLRRRAGEGLRVALGRMTSTAWRSFGVGVVTGGLTQTGVSVAGLAVGSLQTRLLTFVSALGVVVGAQLGAAIVGSLLPLGASREALVLVALGVAWLILSKDPRRRSVAEIVLGLGLLFHGVQILRVGFSPLVEDPEILPYLRYLETEQVTGVIACGLVGALLCTLLQGPGPVFALVLGLVQSSGLIGAEEGLAIMAGTALGTSVHTSIVAWPSGSIARRLAWAHLGFAGLTVVAVLATLPLWASLAGAVAGNDPAEIAYGKKVLYPNASLHLVVSFIASQLVTTLLLAPLVAPLAARLRPRERSEGSHDSGSQKREIDAPKHRQRLLHVLSRQRAALAHVDALARTGMRGHASDAAEVLAAARRELDAVVEGFGVGKRDRKRKRSAITLVHLHGAIESLLRVTDRGVEQGMRLEDGDREVLTAVSGHLDEGFTEIAEALDHDDFGNLDMDLARAREIEINAAEARHRKQLLQAEELGDVSSRMRVSEMLGAYEGVANHLYRFYESFVSALS